MNRLTDLTALQSLQALNSGECSSLDITNDMLKRIEEKEPSVQAFLTRTPDLALRQAKAADEKRSQLKKTGSSIPRLLGLPKFGQGHAAADAMTNRVLRSVCDAYDAYRNRFGRRIKPMIMTFMMAPVAGQALGATPDGRRAGTPITQGLTPQSVAMTQGLTTAIGSANSLDLNRFAGGTSSMWDLDPDYATPPTLKAILQAFLATGGQMYQGNTTDVATLVKARKDPAQYPQLMVRIGGFSGLFVACDPAVQDEIISRRRHGVAEPQG